jgi:hypothetical protein
VRLLAVRVRLSGLLGGLLGLGSGLLRRLSLNYHCGLCVRRVALGGGLLALGDLLGGLHLKLRDGLILRVVGSSRSGRRRRGRRGLELGLKLLVSLKIVVLALAGVGHHRGLLAGLLLLVAPLLVLNGLRALLAAASLNPSIPGGLALGLSLAILAGLCLGLATLLLGIRRASPLQDSLAEGLLILRRRSKGSEQIVNVEGRHLCVLFEAVC